MSDEVVEKSMIEGANGEFIFFMREDVTKFEKTNSIIRNESDGFSADRTRRMNVSVPPRLYYHWARLTGSEDCWTDPAFLRSFMKEHPEYATADYRRI